MKHSVNSFLNFIKTKDRYGAPIALTFEGEDAFKTVRGGIITIAVSIYMLFYIITEFIPVFDKKIDTFQSQTRYYNTSNSFDPFQNGFDFSFGFKETLDPQIASF